MAMPCCADFPYCAGGEAGHLGWGEPSNDVRSGESLECLDTPHRPQAEWPWLKGSRATHLLPSISRQDNRTGSGSSSNSTVKEEGRQEALT